MEESISDKLELLGGSQTFLGVLTTIVILFVINEPTNLIHYILLEVKGKIEMQINSLKVNTGIDSVLNSASHKLLKLFLEKQSTDDKLYAEGSQLLAMITSKRAELQTSYISVEGNGGKILDSIKNSKIPLLAPLYTFVFCITIFIYDELLRSESFCFNNILILSLSCFILVSYLYWSIMWISFVTSNAFKEINNSVKQNKRKQLMEIVTCCKSWYCKKINNIRQRSIIYLFLIRMVFFLLILAITLSINTYLYHINSYIIVLLDIIIPTILIGIIRLYAFDRKENYSYIFMCGHYIAILSMSILLSISFFAIAGIMNSINSVLIPYVGCQWIKISIFGFVLFNGIFLPFMLPYCGYNSYYKFSKKQIVESENKAKVLIQSLRDELDSFSNKIQL